MTAGNGSIYIYLLLSLEMISTLRTLFSAYARSNAWEKHLNIENYEHLRYIFHKAN